MAIIELIKPATINQILHQEEKRGKHISLIAYAVLLTTMFNRHPNLAREYTRNAAKPKLELTDSFVEVDGCTAFDYQENYHCTVFEAYEYMFLSALKKV